MLEAIRYIFDLPLQTDKEYKESLRKTFLVQEEKQHYLLLINMANVILSVVYTENRVMS